MPVAYDMQVDPLAAAFAKQRRAWKRPRRNAQRFECAQKTLVMRLR